MKPLHDTLLPIVQSVIKQFELELIDLELKGTNKNLVVRVYVDQKDGVPLDTCVAVSRTLSDELDIANLISAKYRLEVSSPGTDRPLRSVHDFQRNIGRKICLKYQQNNTTLELDGIIKTISESNLEFETDENKKKYIISFSNIESGKIKLKW